MSPWQRMTRAELRAYADRCRENAGTASPQTREVLYRQAARIDRMADNREDV